MPEVSEEIRKSRIRLGMTQEELAAKLGVSKQYLSLVEKGVKKLNSKRLDELYKIFQDYGIEKDEKTINLPFFSRDFVKKENDKIVFCEPEKNIQVSSLLFPKYNDSDRYSLIVCQTEIMMPTIKPNSYLIIKHYTDEQILDNEIYYFLYNNEFNIRRLLKNVNELILSADSKETSNVRLRDSELKNIHIIGQVTGVIN